MADIKKEFKYGSTGHNFLPSDIITFGFIILLSIIDIIFLNKIKNWQLLLAVNALVVYFIWLIVKAYGQKLKRGEITNDKFSVLRLLRYWNPVILILYIFKQVYYIIYYTKPLDWDSTLISIDRWIFGTDPTVWIYHIANPWLTEFLQIIYIFYYIIIGIYAYELYSNKRFEGLEYAVFILLLGFYISYIGYMIFPAIGPRFHLHSFHDITTELPGIFLTKYLRWILDFGESIPAALPNPQDYAQRDAMPSAHTQIAVILAYLSHRIKSKSFYFYLPYCFLMMFSTIYLRYHYVIDIFAGIIAAIITILIGNYIYRKTGRRIEGF
jgi:membrane-associated phospholipid phosphatase